MSKPSRLVKPSKQSRKEFPGNRSQMLIVGERLMRAGSEGNLVRPRSAQQQDQQLPAHGQDQSTKMLTNPELIKPLRSQGALADPFPTATRRGRNEKRVSRAGDVNRNEAAGSRWLGKRSARLEIICLFIQRTV
ncbi:hypothetical protein SRHO_G00245800 [Serrasalmus rhombeus]